MQDLDSMIVKKAYQLRFGSDLALLHSRGWVVMPRWRDGTKDSEMERASINLALL